MGARLDTTFCNLPRQFHSSHVIPEHALLPSSKQKACVIASHMMNVSSKVKDIIAFRIGHIMILKPVVKTLACGNNIFVLIFPLLSLAAFAI